jgi:transcriptional regulator with XRE-family HTH domain
LQLQRLVELRNKFDLTQEDVANIIGVARTTYAMYEQGHREADYSSLVKLADRYKVSLDYLFGRSNNPIHPESYTDDEIEYVVKSLEIYIAMKRKLMR